jgi:hypothetical protein
MSMSMSINENIINIETRLNEFITSKKVPNIIFHGKPGTGKRCIVNTFLSNIYNNNQTSLKSNILHVNCSLGKGIKFVREELKNFAKSHINTSGGVFKSVVLYNADYLTIDAQSALRRCIEIFSTNTRFFIIIDDKYNLFNPILSRFCEIYIPEILENGDILNLHQQKIAERITTPVHPERRLLLITGLTELNELFIINKPTAKNCIKLIECSNEFYTNGISSFDVVNAIQTPEDIDFFTDAQRISLLFLFQKTRCEFRNESLLIYYLLDFAFMRLCVINKNI